MSKTPRRLAYERWVASQPTPSADGEAAWKPGSREAWHPDPVAQRPMLRRERGKAQTFGEVMADAAAGAGSRHRYAQPTVGLTDGVEVAITFVVGKVERGTLVAFTSDAVAFRRSGRGAAVWVPWRKVRSVRAGPDGPRQRSKPLQTQAIVDLVAEHGGSMPASQAGAVLFERYGWQKNSLTAARRRTRRVDAQYRPGDPFGWWWVLMEPVEPEEAADDDD